MNHIGPNTEAFNADLQRLMIWHNSSPDITPELLAQEVHRVARINSVAATDILDYLLESESRGAAIIRLRVVAETQHGPDISPCGSRSWDECLTLDPHGNFILWYDTPDRSTHISR